MNTIFRNFGQLQVIKYQAVGVPGTGEAGESMANNF